MKIYLVCETDWESHVVLEAWTTKAKADQRARELEEAKLARGKPREPYSIWALSVEDVELKE